MVIKLLTNIYLTICGALWICQDVKVNGIQGSFVVEKENFYFFLFKANPLNLKCFKQF